MKAVTASLQYRSKVNNEEYLLNLVDTPGHVDFSNEVARALVASQSVILLVDANEGVQAQTYANFYLAFVNDLFIVPVLNKVDLKHAKPEVVEDQLENLFDIDKADILRVYILLVRKSSEIYCFSNQLKFSDICQVGYWR